MDYLRRKKDEIVVYTDNTIWLNGSPYSKLTLAELGVPEERVGTEGTTQTFYYKGIIIHAWVNRRAIAPHSEYMRKYRQDDRKQKQRASYRAALSHR